MDDWKVGDSIPLGEVRYRSKLINSLLNYNIYVMQLDDSALIESWDLAFKEYNTFYSIDPQVRNQQVDHRQVLPSYSFQQSESAASKTTSSRKRYVYFIIRERERQ